MMKLMKSCVLAAVLMLGITGSLATRAAAQSDGKMSGTLIDFDGNPFANLPVKIKSEQGVTTGIEDRTGRQVFFYRIEERQVHLFRAASADVERL